MTPPLGRNSPCPCGSGLKVKRCHTRFAGHRVEDIMAAQRAQESAEAWAAEHRAFFESLAGYVPPMLEAERDAWRVSGCPCHDWLEGDEPCAPCLKDGVMTDVEAWPLGGCVAQCGA